jgi:3-methyladenine DNA glycosylase AlkD
MSRLSKARLTIHEIRETIKALGNPQIAEVSQRFFKTGPGQYGEGDIFAGIRVPALRSLAKKLNATDPAVAWELLKSPVHEERLLALFLLVAKFDCSDDRGREAIYSQYLTSTKYINNWDLVDCSAEHIIGKYLFDKDKATLYRLAQSGSLWERRIAILSTFHYIKQGVFDDAIEISKLLLNDKEDLIHKAVGWMLRELGKRNIEVERKFLEQYCRMMPRTMLRYAIEKFPEVERRKYMER